MSRSIWLLLTMFLLVVAECCHGQQEPESTAALWQLFNHVDDDFALDTRDNYQVVGDVQWRDGSIWLGSNASIAAELEAGPKAKVEIHFSFDAAKDTNQSAALIAEFHLRNGHRLSCELLVDDPTTPSGGVVIRAIRAADTEAGQQALRESRTDQWPTDPRWTVEYNFGMLTISNPQLENPFQGYFEFDENRITPLTRFSLRSTGSPVAIERINLDSIKLLPDLPAKDHSALEKLLPEMMKAYESGNFRSGIEPARKIAEITLAGYGSDHPEHATALNNLASFYEYAGFYSKAITEYEKSLRICVAACGANHPATADVIRNMAVLYMEINEYEKAKSNFEAALQIEREIVGQVDFVTLGNYASMLEELGEFDRAEEMLKQVVRLTKAIHQEQHADVAVALSNLAGVYESMGKFPDANQQYQQALKIYETVDSPRNHATCLNNIGALMYSLGKLREAENYYRQARQIRQTLGTSDPEYANSLSNLAMIHRTRQEYDDAIALYKQAADIFSGSDFDKRFADIARIKHNLAAVYEKMGKLDSARSLYEEAINLRRKKLTEHHPDFANSLNSYGGLLARVGELGQAQQHLEKSLEIRLATIGDDHLDVADTISTLGFLSIAQKDLATSKGHFAQALDSKRKYIESNAVILSEAEQRSFANAHRGTLHANNWVAWKLADKTDDLYQPALDWKGATSYRQAMYRMIRDDDTVSGLFDDLERNASSLASLRSKVLVTPPDEPDAELKRQSQISSDNLSSQINRLTEEKQELEAQLAKNSQEFKNLQRRPTVQQLRDALPSDAVLIDFWEMPPLNVDRSSEGWFQPDNHYYAWIIRRDGPFDIVDLGSSAIINQAIDAWLREVRHEADDWKMGQKLRRLIFEKIEPHFAGANILLVSPDGALGKLPLGGLPGSRPDQYLIEEFAIVSVPIPKLLPQMMSAMRTTSNDHVLLTVSNVEYEKANLDYQPLPETKTEIDEIEDTCFRSIPDLTRNQVYRLQASYATELQFKRLVGDYPLIHVATHGLLDRKLTGQEGTDLPPGLRSGLVFLPDIAQEDDGLLTAEEISFIPLRHAQLVVLSACQTALGEQVTGEGLMGLQRAFQIAGARTCIASNWDVPSRSTRQLMSRFYDSMLHKKLGTFAALREAQIYLLHNPSMVIDSNEVARNRGRGETGEPLVTRPDSARDSDRRTTPPRHWAAWSLSGDWR